MSSKEDNHHREMPYRRHHTAPGSPAQHQCTQGQRELHTLLPNTSTGEQLQILSNLLAEYIIE